MSIVLVASSLIPVIFVGSNQTKLLWSCDRYPECDSIGVDTFYVPPNPLGDNKYIIVVLAMISDDSLYWRGNVTFTHQQTAETYFFEYILGGSSTYWGDTALEVWTMLPGSYLISWENSHELLVVPLNYELSSAGLGYPNDVPILTLTLLILAYFGPVAIYIWVKGYLKYKKSHINPNKKISKKSISF